jgi:hypothetical protein
MKAKRLGVYAGITALLASMGTGCAGSGEDLAKGRSAKVASALTGSGPAAKRPRVVTLVTGDQVVVGGDDDTQASAHL